MTNSLSYLIITTDIALMGKIDTFGPIVRFQGNSIAFVLFCNGNFYFILEDTRNNSNIKGIKANVTLGINLSMPENAYPSSF